MTRKPRALAGSQAMNTGEGNVMTQRSIVRRPIDARRWALAVAGLALAIGGACSDPPGGNVQNNGNLLAPTVVPPPPQLTNQAMLSVGGTRQPGNEVMVEFEGVDEALSVAPGLPTAQWSGTIGLSEGENLIAFFVRGASGAESPRTQQFSVTLDTTPPGPVSLKETPPPCVAEASFTLEGTIEEGATLTANGETINTNGTSFTIQIAANGTEVVLIQTDAAGNEGEPVVISVEQGLPVPTLNEVVSPTNELTQLIGGTKAAGMGVLLRPEGGQAEFIVEPNDETTWEFELTLSEGNNTFFIGGRNINGEDACAELGPITIIQSSTCPPVITNADTFPSVTNNPELQVTGTRCAGVDTFLMRTEAVDFEAGEAVAGANDPEDFTQTITLTEGVNTLRWFNRDPTDPSLISPIAGPFVVELDTIPPNPPEFNPVPNGQTSEASEELRGTKDRFSNVCVRVEPNPDCEPLGAPTPGNTFGFTQDYQEGLNTVCISSFDEAGNQSEETCVTIERVGSNAPVIVIQTPQNGTPITDAPFTVRATVTDEVAITEVEICFNNRVDCQVVQGNNDTYTRTITPRNLTNGQSYRVTVTARNDIGGTGVASVTVFYVVEGILLSTSAPEASSERARVALDGEGRLHVVWMDECAQFGNCDDAPNTLPFDVFHRVFDGTAWSDITVVSDDVNDAESESPVIATDTDGNIHVIWQDNGNIQGSGSDFDLMHRMFDINSDSWGPVTVINDNDREDRAPNMAAGGDGSLHVAWERRTNEDGPDDVDIFYARSTDGGLTWDDEIKISSDAGNNRSGNPTIAADSTGVAYVVWQDNGDILDTGDDNDIYLKTVDGQDVGETFVVTDSPLDGASLGPRAVAGPDDRVHIIWEDTATLFNSGTDFDIFYRVFIFGEGFEGNYALISRAPGDGNSVESSLAIDPDTGDAFVAWVDEGNIGNSGDDPDVFYARVFGGIPGPANLVSAGRFNNVSEFPDLIFDPVTNTLQLVWEDDTTIGGDGNDRDIFYLGLQLED